MSEKTKNQTTTADRAWNSPTAQIFFWTVFSGSLIFDLVTKWLAFFTIKPNTVVEAIPGWLIFRITFNEGAVFGLGKGGRWIFIVASILAVGFIIRLFAQSKPKQWILHLLLAMVLGGAIGNLYDRIVYQKVRDFLEIALTVKGVFIWPYIFNVADVILVVGIIGLTLGWITGKFDITAPCPMARPICSDDSKPSNEQDTNANG